MRIVVVDDHEANVALLRHLLESWGFRNIEGMSQSSRVIGRCEADRPDLLLLDLHMPDPDGFAVLDGLHEQIHAAVSLPVLVLTGSDMQRAKQRALEAGARDFLTKPFDVDEIEARVRNNLEIRRLQLAQRNHERELEQRVQARTAELESARVDTLRRLALAGEFRDDQTGEHTHRVGHTSALLAELLSPTTTLPTRWGWRRRCTTSASSRCPTRSCSSQAA